MLDIHRRSPLRRQEEGLCVYISYLPGHNLLCGDARRHFFLEPFFSFAKRQGEEQGRGEADSRLVRCERCGVCVPGAAKGWRRCASRVWGVEH